MHMRSRAGESPHQNCYTFFYVWTAQPRVLLINYDDDSVPQFPDMTYIAAFIESGITAVRGLWNCIGP
jgi:hypothetical protein